MLYNLMTMISFGILLSIMVSMGLIVGVIVVSILEDVIDTLQRAKHYRRTDR